MPTTVNHGGFSKNHGLAQAANTNVVSAHHHSEPQVFSPTAQPRKPLRATLAPAFIPNTFVVARRDLAPAA